MDVVTHAASGAIVALACPHKPRTVWAVPLAALAAAAPDADIFFAPMAFDFLLLHRGITHAFAALPVMGLILACVLFPYWHKNTGGAWSFTKTWAFAMLLVLLHIYLDCVTTYGTLAFLPFSDYRVRLNGIFIIDIFLLLPLLAALWYGARHRRAAVMACIWMLLYPAACVGLRLYHENTLRMQLATTGIYPTQLVVLPDAFAPVFWRLLYQTDNPYTPDTLENTAQDFMFTAAEKTVWHQGLDWRGQPRTPAHPLPAADTRLIDSLCRTSQEAQGFFAFTLLPVQQERAQPDAPAPHTTTEYRFYDLRFSSALPGVQRLFSRRQGDGILFQLQARHIATPEPRWSAVRLAFAGGNRVDQWHKPVPPAPPNIGQWLTGYHTFKEKP